MSRKLGLIIMKPLSWKRSSYRCGFSENRGVEMRRLDNQIEHGIQAVLLILTLILLLLG